MCKKVYRLNIVPHDIIKLLELGLDLKRLDVSKVVDS